MRTHRPLGFLVGVSPRDQTAEENETKRNETNGYTAFYKGKQLEVKADSGYEAQQKAAQMFKAYKSYEVTAILAEKNGQQVPRARRGL